MMKSYLLGIDIGTSACKVAVFDKEGKVLAAANGDYPVYYPQEGWAEQNPEEWWSAVCRATKETVQKAGIAPAEIAGVGIDGQSWSAIALDKEGKVLTNTPIWMDTRAQEICERLNKEIGEDKIFEVAGNSLQPSYTTAKIIWYKENLPEVYTGKRKHTVVAAGRLVEQKNHVNLFYAFRDFLHHYPDYVLHLYGQGELEQDLRELAEKLNIKESVIFEGFHENILNEIKDAGMYVLSSDYEGISNSLLEAMAMGMPVISTDCPSGGSKMCIQNGVNGILVPVAESDALAAAMEKIASSEDFATQIGKEATKVRDRFSMQNIVEQWIELLTEL